MKSKFFKAIALFLLISSTVDLKAQNYIVGDLNFALGMNDYINYANIKRTNSPANLPYEEIKGTPYIFENFATGKVKLKEGKTFEGPIRCDVYAGEFEFKTKEGEIYTIINPETVDNISIDERKFVFISDGKKTNSGNFFEVLLEGKYSLLAKHSVILKDPVPEKPYVPGKPATFVTKDDIFYVLNDKTGLVEIRNKEVLTGIDEKRTESIKGFIKQNKIKTSDKSDLIEMVNFLNAK